MSIRITSGQRITPARLNALAPVVAYKSADEIVNNSTVFQNDDELFVDVDAGASYLGRLHLIISSGATPDFKYQFSAPAGATLPSWTFMIQAAAGGGAAQIGEANSGGVTGVHGFGTNSPVDAWGAVIIGSTAGTLRLQWAQNTANASNTIIRAGSYLELRRFS